MADVTRPIRLADDTTLFLFDDEGVVFCEGTQGVYALNTTATYIWIRCEDGLSRADIGTEMARRFAFAHDAAAAHVQEILDDWRAHGLLADAERPAPERPATTGPAWDFPTIEIDLPANPSAPNRQRTYRILGHHYRLTFSTSDQETWVAPVFAHLQSAKPGKIAATFGLWDIDAQHVLTLDGRPVSTCATLQELGPIANAIVFNECFRHEPLFLAIHAAAVSNGRHALLMPAYGGRGKSSLTAALIGSGFGYMSDDSVLLRQHTLSVAGVPFGLCVKLTGADTLSDYFPGLAALPVHLRSDGKRVRYLAPPNGTFDVSRQAELPARWIVFPEYVAGAATALSPIRASEALRRLVACCAPPAGLDADIVASLVQWIKKVECYELRLSLLADAVSLLRRMPTGDGGSPQGGIP